jgi:hypothetical protein
VVTYEQVEVPLFAGDDGTTGRRYQGADLLAERAAYDYRGGEGDQGGPGQPCRPSPFRPLGAVPADEANVGAPAHARLGQLVGSAPGSGIKVVHGQGGDVAPGVK